MGGREDQTKVAVCYCVCYTCVMDSNYWTLVDDDKRDMTRDQKILFWWLVYMLRVIRDQGVIATPDPSPLTAEQIKTVYKILLDQDEYMGQTWNVGQKNIMVLDNDGEYVAVAHGKIDDDA